MTKDRRYRCSVCKLPAKFVKVGATNTSRHVTTAHDATLQQVLSRSVALKVPVTHLAVPVREKN